VVSISSSKYLTYLSKIKYLVYLNKDMMLISEVTCFL